MVATVMSTPPSTTYKTAAGSARSETMAHTHCRSNTGMFSWYKCANRRGRGMLDKVVGVVIVLANFERKATQPIGFLGRVRRIKQKDTFAHGRPSTGPGQDIRHP
eukprot:scaffold1513_cov100-Amphora_coffeaeformis.AAC.1